jgi:hypothetical protein
VFDNRVLRRIFRPKGDEIIGGRRKLQNKEPHNLYSSPNMIINDQVKEDEMGKGCSTHEGKMNVCRVLVAKPQGKRPLGRFRLRWEDNNKTDLRE